MEFLLLTSEAERRRLSVGFPFFLIQAFKPDLSVFISDANFSAVNVNILLSLYSFLDNGYKEYFLYIEHWQLQVKYAPQTGFSFFFAHRRILKVSESTKLASVCTICNQTQSPYSNTVVDELEYSNLYMNLNSKNIYGSLL